MINPDDSKPAKRPVGRPRLNKPKVKKERVVIPKDDFKYVEMNKILLNVPTLPLVWRARKQLWLIRNIEEHLKRDPLAISAKEYFHLLKEQETIYTELEKKGLGTNEKRRTNRQAILKKRLAETSPDDDTSTVGEGKSAGVGNGVSTPYPFGKQRRS